MIKITIDNSLIKELSNFKGFDIDMIMEKYLHESAIKNFDTMRRFFDECHEFIHNEH
ncbi:hypothetical protein [Methanobrevibacter sp.]